MQQKPFVLVIEDAYEIAVIYTEILEMQGMATEIIMDGAVALQRLETDIPDLVLLDMHLPNVSGKEILAAIRENPRLKRTKVVVITANAHLAQDIEDSADLTLIKPVNATQLRDLSMRMLT